MVNRDGIFDRLYSHLGEGITPKICLSFWRARKVHVYKRIHCGGSVISPLPLPRLRKASRAG
jgi:hypothetical protein